MLLPTQDKDAKLTIPEMETALRGYGCTDRIGDVRLRAYVGLIMAQLDKLEKLGYHKD